MRELHDFVDAVFPTLIGISHKLTACETSWEQGYTCNTKLVDVIRVCPWGKSKTWGIILICEFTPPVPILELENQ